MIEWFFGDLGAWVIAAVAGFLAGALVSRRRRPPGDSLDRSDWLDRELTSGPLGTTITDEQRAAIRHAYGLPDADAARPDATLDDTATSVAPAAAPTAATRTMPPQVAPGSRTAPPPRTLPPQVRPNATSLRELIQHDIEQDDAPAEPFSWDPAVLLLYLGAFLVVASGLVYASYNWADLGAWQKLGLLLALTIAFAGGGWLLLGIERVKEAARTFVAIGALLIPANAIAAASVFDEDVVSLALILLLGSLATALLHGLFSIRPGGVLYRYGAVIAATLAIGAFVPSLGASPAWGAVTALLAAAILPDLVERTPVRFAHLQQPFRFTMAVATVPATLIGIGAWSEHHWLPAVTFAAASVAFARIAIRHQNDAPAVGGSLTMAAIAPAALIALDPGSPAPFAWFLAVASGSMIAAGQVVSPWSNRSIPRTVLHVEAVIGFALAGLLGTFDAPWLGALMLATGAVGATAVAILRGSRWWLLVASAFVAATWHAIPGWDQVDDWDALQILQYSIPMPLVLAALAIAVERWTARDDERDGWDLPVWVAAGIAAIGTTILPLTVRSINERDAGLRWVAVASAVYALGSLVAAWRLRTRAARIGYALWGSLAVVLAVLSLPIHETWQALLVLLATGILALTALPGVLPSPAIEAHDPGEDDPPSATPAWLPSAIFGMAGGMALLVMLVFTAVFIGSAWNDDTGGLPDNSWPWYAYLMTYAAIAAGAILAGLRFVTAPNGAGTEPISTENRAATGSGPANDRSVEPFEQSPTTIALTSIALGFGLVAAWLAMRLVTTDPMSWTRAGLALGIGLVAAASQDRWRDARNAFARSLASGSIPFGVALAGISALANLLLAIDDPDRVSDGGQAITFALAGLAVFAIAWWQVRSWLAVSGLTLLAVATVFAARTGDNHAVAVPAGLVILAWVTMGTTIALQRTERGERLAPMLRLASLGVGFAAIAAAVALAHDLEPDSSGWRMLTFTLVMTAALLATEGWLRQDRRWVIGASVLAMAALLLQIGGREPSNIQAYTVPLAIYLLALGWFSRRNRALRDALLAMGSISLLTPPLLLAQSNGDATQLLIGGVEALVLFVVGVFLRLRVAIAAGVAAMSLIVLRFLVDAAIALPGWISLLAGGLLLLLIGTLLTIWKDEARTRLERLQAGWHEMG